MAAIYISGRVPQIWLNVSVKIKDFSFSGLNYIHFKFDYIFIYALLLLISSCPQLLIDQIKRGSVEVILS